MIATQSMLAEQAARYDAQAAREREWRRQDVEMANRNLEAAARGNATARWCAVAVALFAAIVSLGLSFWTAGRTQSIVVVPAAAGDPQGPFTPASR